MDFHYHSCIEKADLFEHPLSGRQAAYAPPPINFGVLPVQTSTPLNPTAMFAPVCGIYEIEFELEI